MSAGANTTLSQPITYQRMATLTGTISSNTGTLPSAVTVNFSGYDVGGHYYTGTYTLAAGVGSYSFQIPTGNSVSVAINNVVTGFGDPSLCLRRGRQRLRPELLQHLGHHHRRVLLLRRCADRRVFDPGRGGQRDGLRNYAGPRLRTPRPGRAHH